MKPSNIISSLALIQLGARVAIVAAMLWTSNACLAKPSRAALDQFERHIRPLLVKHCVACHGPKKQESGLRLDSRSSAFADHEFGRAIVPGDVAASRLLRVLEYRDDDVQMPPQGKLADAERKLLTDWVQSGAAWPAELDPAQQRRDAWKTHWAFQPITRPEPPRLEQDDWSRRDLDRFVFARLQAAGRRPSPVAEPRVQVRRLWFDLTGLPPTLADVQRFDTQPNDATWAALVDELLASPQFGERWARHWMDIARYSDTTGYLFQEERKLGDAWKYRDWLIRAFNQDLPIDQFLARQLAVDRLVADAADEELAATGFLTLGRRFLNNKHDIIDDRIDVMTRGMMGLTVTCARCHDHKYDPIPSADYYSLYGVFASTKEPDRKKTTVRLVDLERPFAPYVFVRGQSHNRGKSVPRQFLAAVDPEREPFKVGSGRVELAQAIVNKDNPLTSRVFVNRVWGHLFGKHMVATPSDFGVRSEPPSHPQLLDFLAASFVDEGWSFKSLLREILLSSTYRQSSNGTADSADPENRLLARMNRRRLSFEAQRDAMLHAAGKLEDKIGGPSVDITKEPYSNRRSLYAYIDRQNLPGVFRSFDLANPDTHAPRRFETTVPQQGLYWLNNPFVLQQAQALSQRGQATADPKQRVRTLFEHALARAPTAAELEVALLVVTGMSDDKQVESWQYGYGTYDSDADRVTKFTEYPVFVEGSWRGGTQLPDKKIGWSFLNDRGGHPGTAGYAAIRRWQADKAGKLLVRGTLRNPTPEGDGVVGRIVSSRSGQQGTWQASNGAVPTIVESIDVQVGDTIDFVCEMGGSISHDSFEWKTLLRFEPHGGKAKWHDSAKEFTGGSKQHYDAWARLAHVLLMTNEFVFVD